MAGTKRTHQVKPVDTRLSAAIDLLLGIVAVANLPLECRQAREQEWSRRLVALGYREAKAYVTDDGRGVLVTPTHTDVDRLIRLLEQEASRD